MISQEIKLFGTSMDRLMKDMADRAEPVSKSRLCDNEVWEKLSVEEMLCSLETMPQPPPLQNLVCTLIKCKKAKQQLYALRMHAYLHIHGLEGHRLLGNSLLSMLVEVGNMQTAHQVFERLDHRNAHSWCFLITSHVRSGDPHHAFILYDRMQHACVLPTGPIFVALLKACALLKNIDRGYELHAQVARLGLGNNLFIACTMVDMYAKCSMLARAQEVFNALPYRDVILWNALIAGYAEHGRCNMAIECFEQMQLDDITPSVVTYILALKSCGNIGDVIKAQELHAEVVRKGLLRKDCFGSTLVETYANCGLLDKAQEIFDNLPSQDAHSWNALIAGYAKHGCDAEALHYFEEMQLHNVVPDPTTFACSLNACCCIQDEDKGQDLHTKIIQQGLEQDLGVGNALVHMYASCGLLVVAQQVLDGLLTRNNISWTGLIAGYVKHGYGEEALNCLEMMQSEGIAPDAFTFVCSLKACANIGAAGKGNDIHAKVLENGLLESSHFIGCALVDMYASCGLLTKAHDVFDKLSYQDLASWTALIAGYAQLGECEEALHVLDRMEREGVTPNWVTFLNVFSACSHAGLLDLAQWLFEAMNKKFGITPTIEHYTCIIDVIGRAGQIDKVVTLIDKVPFHPNLVMWHAVLGACRKWGNVELGREAFYHAVGLNVMDTGAYFGMFNIYQDAGLYEDARKIDITRSEKQGINSEHKRL